MSQDFGGSWKETKARFAKLTEQIEKEGKTFSAQDTLTLKNLIEVYIERPGAVASSTASSGAKKGQKKASNAAEPATANDPMLISQLDATIQGHLMLYGGHSSSRGVDGAPAKKIARVPPKRKFKFAAKDLAAQSPASPFSSGSDDSGDDTTLAFRYKANGKITGVDASGLAAYWQPYTEDELRIIDIACVGVENGEEKQTHCIRRIAAELGRSENGVTTKLRDRLNYLRLVRGSDPAKKDWTAADFICIEEGKRPRGRPRKNFGSYSEGTAGRADAGALGAVSAASSSSTATAASSTAATGAAFLDILGALSTAPAAAAAPARASRSAGKA